MAVRLATLLPRAVVMALVWVLATAAFTFAADTTIMGPSSAKSTSARAQAPELVVPSVTGQAYVFAKGILEDGGFAWHLSGSVHGYASNRVMAQTPAAGTRVVDTGAPAIVLRLVRGPYPEHGRPVDTSSYRGTKIKLANLAAATVPVAPVKKPAAKPATKRVVKPVAKPKPKPKPKLRAKPKLKPKAAPKPAAPSKRRPSFIAPGAPTEPLDEITLPARALRLEAWLATRPKTSANVQNWLYQHAWIVTGAKFGWWHGAQALESLIRVDERVQRQWGIGRKSEAVARATLAKVRREAR
jgi:beta-lactam-binding protein with PASTA domain